MMTDTPQAARDAKRQRRVYREKGYDLFVKFFPDVDARRAINSTGFASAVADLLTTHAKDAADQRQAEIVDWLREFGNHPPAPNCPRCNIADELESGTWRDHG